MAGAAGGGGAPIPPQPHRAHLAGQAALVSFSEAALRGAAGARSRRGGLAVGWDG